jgi:hypothetical protein
LQKLPDVAGEQLSELVLTVHGATHWPETQMLPVEQLLSSVQAVKQLVPSVLQA